MTPPTEQGGTRRRCGWCGAYEGTVDPNEPCRHAVDPATGDIMGPHQFPERREGERRGTDLGYRARSNKGKERLGVVTRSGESSIHQGTRYEDSDRRQAPEDLYCPTCGCVTFDIDGRCDGCHEATGVPAPEDVCLKDFPPEGYCGCSRCSEAPEALCVHSRADCDWPDCVKVSITCAKLRPAPAGSLADGDRWGENWDVSHPDAVYDLCEEYAEGGLDTVTFVTRVHKVVEHRLSTPGKDPEERIDALDLAWLIAAHGDPGGEPSEWDFELAKKIAAAYPTTAQQDPEEAREAVAKWLHTYYWRAQGMDPPRPWKEVVIDAGGAFRADADAILAAINEGGAT